MEQKNLTKNERGICGDLKPGDRFCFLNDKKRLVYQVMKREWKKLAYISAAIVDRGWTEEKLIEWSTRCSYQREIIFLRNVNESNDEKV